MKGLVGLFGQSYKVRKLKRALRRLASLRKLPDKVSYSNLFTFNGPCPCCGSDELTQIDVLWEELIDAWELSVPEVAYINRQQGFRCRSCGCNLRSMALAAWVLRHFHYAGPLTKLARATQSSTALLEINEAGGLHDLLTKLPGHTFAEYPAVDIQNMPYATGAFDVVLHSDTLEHVQSPSRALSECRRVLRNGGVCAFTVPVVVDRLTRSTSARRPSYHGHSGTIAEDYKVQTEFGADVWKTVITAGFREYVLFPFEYPAALVHVAFK